MPLAGFQHWLIPGFNIGLPKPLLECLVVSWFSIGCQLAGSALVASFEGFSIGWPFAAAASAA